MEMLSAFSTTLHVPNLSTPDHLLSVLEEVELFSKDEIVSLHAKLLGKRYVFILKNYQCRKHDLYIFLSEFLLV